MSLPKIIIIFFPLFSFFCYFKRNSFNGFVVGNVIRSKSTFIEKIVVPRNHTLSIPKNGSLSGDGHDGSSN